MLKHIQNWLQLSVALAVFETGPFTGAILSNLLVFLETTHFNYPCTDETNICQNLQNKHFLIKGNLEIYIIAKKLGKSLEVVAVLAANF